MEGLQVASYGMWVKVLERNNIRLRLCRMLFVTVVIVFALDSFLNGQLLAAVSALAIQPFVVLFSCVLVGVAAYGQYRYKHIGFMYLYVLVAAFTCWGVIRMLGLDVRWEPYHALVLILSTVMLTDLLIYGTIRPREPE